MFSKSIESPSKSNLATESVKLLSAATILSLSLNVARANAEVPIGNLTPFTTETMKDTNAGVILQNFNGQNLNSVYLRTNSQELGITKLNQPKINASILLSDNNSQNYQLSTKIGDFYPYTNLALNQGQFKTTTGVFTEFNPSSNLKITGLAEVGTSSTNSKPDILLRAGVGYKF
jgi:hypothetical protein